MSEPKEFKVGVVSTVGVISTRVASIASALVIAPVIGPVGYGTFVLARDFCVTLSMFSKLGLDLGLVRILAERQQYESVIRGILLYSFGTVLVLSSILIAALNYGGSEWVESNLYTEKGFSQILSTLALIIPLLTIVSVSSGALRGLFKITTAVIGELIIQPVSRIILIVIFFCFSPSVESVIWATILSFLLTIIYLCVKGYHFSIFNTKIVLPKCGEYMQILRYSIGVSVLLSVGLLLQKTDVFLIGYFANVEDVGRYAVVQLSAALITTMNTAFSQKLAPDIAVMVSDNDARLHERVSTHVHWMALLSAPLFAVFVVYGGDLLKIFGRDYAIEFWVLLFLGAGQYIQAIFSSVGLTLSMSPEYRSEFSSLLTALLVNVVLNILLIPHYGLVGASIATLSSIVLSNVIRLIVVYRLRGIFPVKANLILITCLALSVTLCLRIISVNIFEHSVLGALIGGLVSTILCGLIFVRHFLNKEHRDDLIRQISSWKS